MSENRYDNFEKMRRIQYVLFALSTIFFFTCDHAEKKTEYGKATRELVEMTEQMPDLKSLLTHSIEKARQVNPDKNTNPVQSLNAYFDFVSYCEKAMPWTLLGTKAFPEIYADISKSLRYFYFLIDQPLEELEGKGYYNNSLQYAEPFASWVVRFSKSWGQHLNSEESWKEEYYQMALKDSVFGLHTGWYEDPSNWKTFNHFFARRLRSPDLRPIADPEDNSIVVSFADSRPHGVWPVDSNSNIVMDKGVPVKSAFLRSVSKLIGSESQYNDAFVNGTFMHSFLGINDYHRYHFPLNGMIREVRIIQGINPSGGELKWDAKNQRYAFDPSSIGWQLVETRGCVILDTEDYGLVALIPVGMAVIGSVNFEESVFVGARVRKGDMMGNFAFGGSDFIMILQEHVNFTLDVPRQENSDLYEHILMGERLGFLTKN